MLPRTRATFVGLRMEGAGHWVFEGRRGVVVEPWRPALAEGLASLRMGQFVVDDAAARRISDMMAGEERILTVARGARAMWPRQAADSGLRIDLDYYEGWRRLHKARLEGALAVARSVLDSGEWMSIDDFDMAVVEETEGRLKRMEEVSARISATPPPAPPTPIPRPPATQGPPAPPTPGAWLDGLSTPAKVGLGAGAGALLLGLGYAILG